MRTIKLLRVAKKDDAVYGVYLNPAGYPFAVSLELPWVLNKKNISCIPAGEYFCKLKNSPSRGTVYELQDVPGRTYIYIHVGNFPRDTKGCLLIAESFESYQKSQWVKDSKKAFRELQGYIGEEFIFKILDTKDWICL